MGTHAFVFERPGASKLPGISESRYQQIITRKQRMKTRSCRMQLCLS